MSPRSVAMLDCDHSVAPTNRELEVFGMYWRMRSTKRAASALGLKPDSVRATLSHLYRKLSVSCAYDAAVALGWKIPA